MDACVRWRRAPIPANAITAGRLTWNSSSPISSGCSDGGKTTPMATREDIPAADRLPGGSSLEVLAVFFRLGLTSFGGPVAHLGYFREEFVRRRRWLDDKSYADLLALCQFLPGPASSQVGIAVGLLRGGYAGALAAWIGFTLPSAVAMVLFGYGIGALGDAAGSGWLHGLKVAAVAVVAQAVLGMARTLAPDRARHARGRRRHHRTRGAVVVGADRRDRARRHRRRAAAARRRGRRAGRFAAAREPRARRAAAGGVLRAADRIAAAGSGDSLAGAQGVRRVLSRGFAGVRRRARGAAAVAGVRRAAGLGRQRRLTGRLRRRASRARTVVHLRRLSRHGDGAQAERLDRGIDLSHRDFPAVVPPRHRRAAVLHRAASAHGRVSRVARRLRSGGGLAAGRALPAGMDRGHHQCRGFCAGGRGISPAVHVADAALAGGDPQRRGRRVDLAAIGRGLITGSASVYDVPHARALPSNGPDRSGVASIKTEAAFAPSESTLPTCDVSVSVVLKRLRRSPPHGAYCLSRAACLLPRWRARANPHRTRCLRNCASRRRCRECVAADRRGRLPNRSGQIARGGKTPRGGGRRKCRRM